MHKLYQSLNQGSQAHRGWLIAFIAVIALRIWFGLLGVYAILFPNKTVLEPLNLYWGLPRPPQEGFWLLLTPWERWDTIWYLRITTFGYAPDDPSASFFPLFPILARALGGLFDNNYLLSGIVVCSIATFFAFGLLYRITADWADEATATRAVVQWAIFPTSFYMLGGYAESVLAACTLASIYFAQRRHWWLAGMAALGATITRPVGIIILAPLAILAWRQGANFRERVFALFLSAAGVAIGFGGWMFYLQATFNDAMLWTHSQDFWVRVFVLPWNTLGWTAQFILDHRFHFENNIVDLVLTLLALGAILLCIRKLPFAFSAYALVMLIVPLTSYAIRDDFWASMPMAAAGRRAMVVFPIFIALGSLIKWKWLLAIWIPFSLACQAILFVSFAQWVWVD